MFQLNLNPLLNKTNLCVCMPMPDKLYPNGLPSVSVGENKTFVTLLKHRTRVHTRLKKCVTKVCNTYI